MFTSFFQFSLCFTSLPPRSVPINLLPSANLVSQTKYVAGGDLMCMSAQQQRGAMHWRHGGCLITTVTSFLMLSERHVLYACQVAKRKSSERCCMYRLPSSLNQVCSRLYTLSASTRFSFFFSSMTRRIHNTCSAFAMYASTFCQDGKD